MVTIYDVARSAGVSPKTVSRVLNADAPVRADTRAQVERAMAELGYAPSPAARAMRSGRTGLVGLLAGTVSAAPPQGEATGLPDLPILRGIQRTLEAAGLALLIADTGGRPDTARAALRALARHRVEGLIRVADHHRRLAPLGGAASAVEVIANGYDDLGTPAVVPDDRGGMRALMGRILALGHRRVAYLTLRLGIDATRLRLEGYREALAAAGLPFDPALVIQAEPDDPPQDGRLLPEAVDRALALADRPTAICCGNDRMAIGVYGLLRTRGLRLPEDMSVAGYDDHRTISEALHPALTTVTLPYDAMGALAARLMLERLHETAQPEGGRRVVEGEVAWRVSVAPPACS